jgi:hypothetical protein
VIEQLLADLGNHIAAARNVDANTALGALALLAARYLAHAAWLVTNNLTESRPADADHLAALADRLGLVGPRLVHRHARAVAGTGDLPTAIALLNPGLAARDGSSDRAWADLTAYRDALAARQAAAQRGRSARPHRRGHSAPASRPLRRRFTASPPV